MADAAKVVKGGARGVVDLLTAVAASQTLVGQVQQAKAVAQTYNEAGGGGRGALALLGELNPALTVVAGTHAWLEASFAGDLEEAGRQGFQAAIALTALVGATGSVVEAAPAVLRALRARPPTSGVMRPQGATGVRASGAPQTAGSLTTRQRAQYLFDNWSPGTFENRTRSVAYHLEQHGGGRSAYQYTRDAMEFFAENRSLGSPAVLKNGAPGIRIQTKQPLPGGGIRNVGGWWTADGRLVTFWD